MDEIDWAKMKSTLDEKTVLVGEKYTWGQRYGGPEIRALAEQAQKKMSEKEPTVCTRLIMSTSCSTNISLEIYPSHANQARSKVG